MIGFFADPTEQDTRGDRGKTTRRKGTKTVCGSEGAWIAEMKERLGPMYWYTVWSVTVRWNKAKQEWVFREYPDGRWKKEDEATAYMAATPCAEDPDRSGRSFTIRKYIRRTARRLP